MTTGILSHSGPLSLSLKTRRGHLQFSGLFQCQLNFCIIKVLTWENLEEKENKAAQKTYTQK